MKFIIISGFLIGLFVTIEAQTAQTTQTAPMQNFLVISKTGNCEGKDSANMTFVAQYTTDSSCSPQSAMPVNTIYGISCSSSGERTVSSLTELSFSNYPAGAYEQSESLHLVQSGNLQGKYVYFKSINLVDAYLKKCSSVLGYSYISSKGAVVLIADKLDLNIFLAPGGAFEPFKKSASTVCELSEFTV